MLTKASRAQTLLGTSLLTALLAVAPLAAHAHTGPHAMAMVDMAASQHASLGALLAGVLHPFSGWDHWAAALLVGAWGAVTLPRSRAWVAPLVFTAVLAVGAWASLSLNQLTPLASLVEPMIVASVLAFSALLAWRPAVGMGTVAMLVGCFAVFHGMAHGQELAGHGQPGISTCGVVLGTGLLHGLGVVMARRFTAAKHTLARLTSRR